MAFLYDCGCEDCKTNFEPFKLSLNDSFKNLLKTAEKAFKQLHKNKGYKPEDLTKEKAYNDLLEQTSNIFNSTLTDNVVEGELLRALQEDVFLFSGLKTHAQLTEASRLLLDSEGKIKPWQTFSKDFESINSNYNQNYLEAEYLFAVSSAQSAGAWESQSNNSDRYLWQYRTSNDERVRESHRALEGITLPKSDPFWDSYYPPNGWRCRCISIEVLKGKYEMSDSESAIKAGEKATTQIGKDGKNKLEIFRFNPGKQKVIFPPKHPYNLMSGASKVKKAIGSSGITESRNSVKQWMNKTIDKNPLVFDTSAKHLDKVTVTKSSVKAMISKGHNLAIERNNAVMNLKQLLDKSEYVGWAEDEIIGGKQKHNDVDFWQYYKVDIGGEKSVVCIKKTKNGLYKPHAIEEEKEFEKNVGIKKESPKR